MVGTRFWVGLGVALALAGCSSTDTDSSNPDAVMPGGAEDDSPSKDRAPTRSDIDCPSYLAETVRKGASIDFPVSVDTTWGGLPEAWHALPAGAELCGAVYFLDDDGNPQNRKGDLVSAMIRSPLWGNALKTYYDPVLAAAGCTPSDDRSEDGQTRLSWTCADDAGYLAQAITDTSYNVYLLSGILP
jgi:hypothetical protein